MLIGGIGKKRNYVNTRQRRSKANVGAGSG